MSNYDPYNNSSYYNPSTYANDTGSEGSESIVSGVKQFALHAIGFMAAHHVGKGIMKFAGKRAAAGVASWAKTAKAGSLGLSAQKLSKMAKAKTFGDTLRGASSRIDRAATTLSSRMSYDKAILSNRDSYLNTYKKTNPLGHGVERFKSATKNLHTMKAVAGRVITRDIVAGSLIGYGVDAATGQLSHYGVRDDISAANIPGHMLNYGKYMLKNAGTFAMMGNLPKLAGGALSAVGLGAKAAIGHNSAFSKTVQEFASKVAPSKFAHALSPEARKHMKSGNTDFENSINNSIVRKRTGQMTDAIGATVSGLETGVRKMFNGALDRVWKPGGNAGGASAGVKFQAEVERTLSGIKEDFKQRQVNRTVKASSGLGGLEQFALFESHAKGKIHSLPANVSKNEQKDNFNTFMEMVVGRNDQMKPSKLGAVLGYRPTRVGDVVNADYIKSLSEQAAAKFATNDANGMAKMIKNLQIGDSHYTNGKFNADLSYFQPKHILRRMGAGISKINLHMAVPLPMVNKNMSLGSILGLDAIVSEEVSATMFSEQTTGFGRLMQTKHGKRQIGELLADAQIVKGNNDLSVAFSGRKLYAIDGAKITPLDNMDNVLKHGTAAVTGHSELQKTEYTRWLFEGAKHPDPARQKYFKNMQQQLDNYNKPGKGIFGAIAAKFDWSHTAANQMMRNIEDLMATEIGPNGKAMSGHQKMYASMAEMIEGKNVSFDQFKDHIPYLKNLMDQSEQEVFGLLRKPGAFEELAKHSRLGFKVNKNILYDSQSFTDYLKGDFTRGVGDPKSVFYRVMGDNETKALYNLTIGNSGPSDTHILRTRMGRFSDMKAIDGLRTRVFEAGMKDDMLHPFVTSAAALEAKGVINSTEASAMKIYGMTKTMFRDFGASGKRSETGRNEFAAIQKIFKYHSKNKLIQQNEFTKYVMNTDLRPPSFLDPASQIARKLGHDPQSLVSEFTNFTDSTNFISIGVKDGSNSFMGGLGMVGDVAAQRVTNLISDITGFQRDPFKYGNGMLGATKFVATRAAQISAGIMAYKAADAFVAANPIFDDTQLDEGITGVIADTVAKTHLMSSRFLNATGIAGIGRHLNGLMPGFTSGALGAAAGAAFNFTRGPMGVLDGALRGALGAKMVSAYMPDFTKTYEQLEAEYSGDEQVAIMKGKGWLLGATPWQGNKVVGYKPNWYVEAKSRWKASETLYGSEVRKLLHEPIPILGLSIGDFVDPYYMERKHFFDRPYHTTAGFQENMPFGLGPIISATIGRVIKPKKIMHEEFLHGRNEGEHTPVSAMPIPTMKEQMGIAMKTGVRNPRMGHNKTSTFMGSYVYSPNHKNYAQNVADAALNDLESGIGLVGFGANTMRNLVDKPRVTPTLESAGRMASMSRAYNDETFGGLGVFSEVMRRFIRKPNHKQHAVNETPNMLPNWLPARYMKGDPYSKIIKGEIRLPGKAYELTHDVNYSLPGRASMFGAETDDIVKYFTGFKTPLLKESLDILDEGTEFHEKIQQWLKSENILISAENFVYDAKNNLSGHIDGVIQDGFGGQGRRALEIKSISQEGLEKLKGPKNQHVGQLNFYLHQMKMRKGTILYVSRDNPADYKVFEIQYSQDRYARDIQKIHKARGIASQMLAKGKQGMAKGFSYSWVDRMRILADVAPASKQWKEAKWIVQQQMKSGMLTERQINKFNKSLKIREATLRGYETYPLRFKGKIMTPDAEYNRQNINENIKAGAEYSLPERIVGAAWEAFTNTNTFLVNKFFAYKDPLEHYKQNQLYGKEFTPWTDPWGSFIQPRINNIAGSTSVVQGALAGGLDSSYVAGGLGMGTIGTMLGGIYGGLNGLARNGKSAYIPGQAETEREVNDYFDTLKYYKNQRMASLSEGFEADRYRNQANETFHSMLNSDKINYTNVFKAAYDTERPYINAWLNETDTNRQKEILNMIPGRLAETLKTHWQAQGSKLNTKSFIDESSADLASGRKTLNYDMRLLDPGLRTEDIKLKAINNEGLNAHDFGLGWGEQMLRVQDQMDQIAYQGIDMNPLDTASVDPGTIRTAIFNLMSQLGLTARVKVFVNNHTDGENKATLTIQENRLQDIRNAVDFRARFM